MTAYIIVDINVHNREKFPEYIAKITPTVFACGGRYLARGTNIDVVSGSWQPKRIVVIEFPNVEIAQHWANCAEYAPIHALRHQYANANMIIVEGCPNPDS